MERRVNIAVQGCSHGELDSIYHSIRVTEQESGQKIDILFLCGDLQCVRDAFDLECVAVPPKYRRLNTFHQYVTGEKVAPVLTVFVGGNHEASNILQSLYYGGFVAPNIYFMGFAGVINVKGLRIAGVSGIFNERHYTTAHYETAPYTEGSLRSVYHLRQLEVFRLKHLVLSEKPIDIFLSHDWPQDIWDYGDKEALLRIKPYFREDIESRKLGSPPLKELLAVLRPKFWFAAHLHVKFAAVVVHTTTEIPPQLTRFLALDKVIPGRGYLQYLQIPIVVEDNVYYDENIHLDLEWATILSKTHSKLQAREIRSLGDEHIEILTEEEKESVNLKLVSSYGESLAIPNIPPSPILCGSINKGNPQTDRLLSSLKLPHIWTQPTTTSEVASNVLANTYGVAAEKQSPDPNEIEI